MLVGSHPAFCPTRSRRLNAILNSIEYGAVAGSPGTAATGQENTSSAYAAVAGIGVEDGLDYIDLRVTGNFGGAFNHIFYRHTPAFIPVPHYREGTVWTLSFWAKLVAGSNANMTCLGTEFGCANAGGSYISNPIDDGTFRLPPTSGPLLQPSGRWVTTRQLDAGTFQASFGVTFLNDGSGVSVDATYRIGGIQAEPGGNPTPYIRNPRTTSPMLVA